MSGNSSSSGTGTISTDSSRFIWVCSVFLFTTLSLYTEVGTSKKTITIGNIASQFLSEYAGAVEVAVENFEKEGLLNDTNIRIIYDSHHVCDLSQGVNQTFQMYFDNRVDVIVGEPCSAMCSQIGYYLSRWNLPFISEMCGDDVMMNKTTYDTLIRVGGVYKHVGTAFLEIFLHYNWNRTLIFYQNVITCYVSGSSIAQTLARFEISIAEWIVAPATGMDDKLMVEYLERIRDRARVIVCCFESTKIQERFLFLAQDMGMADGTYTFINYAFAPDENTWHPWATVNSSHPDFSYRQAAFVMLKQITFPLLNETEIAELFERIRAIGPRNPWFKNQPMKPHQFSLYLYDATKLYLLLLSEVLQNGEDHRNGTLMFQMARNRSFQGKSGTVKLDRTADRIINFNMWTLVPNSTRFTIALEVDLSVSRERVKQLQLPYWSLTSTTPPLAVPPCRSRNILCSSDTDAHRNVWGPIVGFILLVILFLTWTAVKKMKLKSRKHQTLWRIAYEDLTFPGTTKTSTINLSISTMGTHVGITKTVRDTAVYKSLPVHVKYYRKKNFSLTPEATSELSHLKELNHQNICEFIGVCSTKDQDICFAVEYCGRGSLQEIVQNDAITLDVVFKMSLISDLVQGMLYLHNSKLQSHGHLKSSCCYVNSRWTLKISGFVLRAFGSSISAASENMEDEDHYREMLWTAPELLRHNSTHYRGSRSGDVYSFGVILQELIYREKPLFYDSMTLKTLIKNLMEVREVPYRPPLPANVMDVSPDIVSLIDLCWQERPEYRPSFRDLHRLINQFTKHRKFNIVDCMLHKLERYTINLEELVKQRTIELTEEKQKTDILLYRLLPMSVAESLKQGKQVTPSYFSEVTVYFSDIVGFTRMSSQISPMQVVELLNLLYTTFDCVLLNYDVYKVETIGDAYMVISGAPNANGSKHVVQIADTALDLLKEVRNLANSSSFKFPLQLRSGIHTGPCAAGVVGLTMPRYCVFGDTVHLASKMESTGEPQKIQISEKTYNLLLAWSKYSMSYKGIISTQNSEIKTYWLHGYMYTTGK